jgi:MFS family permease
MTGNPYAALKIRDFRFYLSARILVTVAWQILGVAAGWQIYALTKDPLSLGLLGLSAAFPAIAIALYAGHVADVVDRKLVALGAVFVFTFSLTLLAVCSAGGVGKNLLVGAIYFGMALVGLARGLYGPAVFGILGDIVPRELYGNAIAWNTMTWQGSALMGTVLGGTLYVWVGAAATYFISAGLLATAFCFFLLVKSKTVIVPKEPISVVDNIREGLRFVLSNQILLGVMALDLFGTLFGGVVALLPIYTAEVFHLGPQALGILRAAPPFGGLLITSVLTHRPLADRAGAVLLAVMAGFGLCVILFGISTSFYFSLFLLCLGGALDGISMWIRMTIFQLITPGDMKGRVSSVNSIFVYSSNDIGEFESGVTARLMGLVPSVVFGGLMTLAVVLITCYKAPRLRDLHLRNLYAQTEEEKESPAKV